MALLSVEEAHQRLMALFAPVGTEDIPVAEAAGRTLAADVVAKRDQPPFDASAMDGYACRRDDARPGATLSVIGSVPAGQRFRGRLRPGEAVRIFTGAPVPVDADWILIQEDASVRGDRVTVVVEQGGPAAIRRAGDDFPAAFRIAAPRRLGPADVGLLAAMGADTITVSRRPVVALVPTGDELVATGEEVGPDQIVSSNDIALKAVIEAAGGSARRLPIARDTPESLMASLALAAGANLIVTIGGASVGDFDLVRTTAERAGLALAFHRIAMRPGKPLLAGRYGDVPLIGLPGNPASAFVTAHVFVRPAIDRMLGMPAGPPELHPARLSLALEPNGPRTHYVRARTEAGAAGWVCAPLPRQDSSLVSVLAAANALLVRSPHDPALSVGDRVGFIWL